MRPHVDPPPAHHFFIPRVLRHIPCTSLNSSSSPLSDSFSPSDSVLVCIHLGFSCQSSLHPGLSCQGSLNNPFDSLAEFILTWFCRFSMHNKQRVSGTTSHVSVNFNIRIQDVEFSTLRFPKVPRPTFLADLLMPILFPRSLDANGCETNFPSPTIHQASLKICRVQLLLRTIPLLVTCTIVLVRSKWLTNIS